MIPVCCAIGSSPRLWGTPPPDERLPGPTRFIPTPVGNTYGQFPKRQTYSVHPHACGEHDRSRLARLTADGSSPRLWGTLRIGRGRVKRARFIPTPVGNTLNESAHLLEQPVHPHACGEHSHPGLGHVNQRGSSPRLWGTPAVVDLIFSWQRFIPTPVGNTRWFCKADLICPVHPHACGEHNLPRAIALVKLGSSPRLWGTRPQIDHRSCNWRFIPTPVGNTGFLSADKVAMAVHPHACGEHKTSVTKTMTTLGSSPRLWGTQNKPYLSPRSLRFIPTPVGNTLSSTLTLL